MIIDSGMIFNESFFTRDGARARDATPLWQSPKSLLAWRDGWDKTIASAHAVTGTRRDRMLTAKRPRLEPPALHLQPAQLVHRQAATVDLTQQRRARQVEMPAFEAVSH